MERPIRSQVIADPLSKEESLRLHAVCDRYIQEGGEIGAIAKDIKHISNELTALSEQVQAFLKR